MVIGILILSALAEWLQHFHREGEIWSPGLLSLENVTCISLSLAFLWVEKFQFKFPKTAEEGKLNSLLPRSHKKNWCCFLKHSLDQFSVILVNPYHQYILLYQYYDWLFLQSYVLLRRLILVTGNEVQSVWSPFFKSVSCFQDNIQVADRST